MQAILQHIFGKDLQEVPLEALQHLTTQYPFFGPGQFLLAKKLYETDPAAFLEQVKNTALYFSNPLWLEHLLTVKEIQDIQTSKTKQTTMPIPAELISVMHPEVEFDEENGQVEAAIASGPLLKNWLTSASESDTLELPAYHTIDYFASQGIQLQSEEEADKLGKQLKSFTEWLKIMRRLPQATTGQVEKINEEAIYQQASGSLEEREIVTETMAEVLVKQQDTQKAIQIYHKLGLQYPSKKAYFAAKIQALKQ